MKEQEKLNERIHIYVDESGDVAPIANGGKPLFLVGCIITDDPAFLNKKVMELKEEIKNKAYYHRNSENFEKEGFHASTNHPDIYGRFVALLNTLNFRGYVVFVDKTNEKYPDVAKQYPDLYLFLLKILLRDRLLKRKDHKVHIVIEQNTTKLQLENVIIANLLKDINDSLVSEGLLTVPLNVTFTIQGKNEDAGVDVVDYMNHIIFTAKAGSDKEKKYPKTKQNLELIEPKIAFVGDILNKRYFKGRKQTEFLFDFLSSV